MLSPRRLGGSPPWRIVVLTSVLAVVIAAAGPRLGAEETDGPSLSTAALVGDVVFLDGNRNGQLDPGEYGVAGVIVTIELPPADGFSGYAETVLTDGDGRYTFAIDGIPADAGVVGRVWIDLSKGGARGREPTTANPRDTLPLAGGSQDFSCVFGLQTPDVQAKMCADDAVVLSKECVDVPVLLSISHPVEGFVTALRHDEGLDLESIGIAGTAAELNGADFTSFELVPGGGTAGVIMDMREPYDGNAIPPGENLAAVVYRYCTPEVPAGAEPRVFRLWLVDGELGSPAKENVVVVGGLSFTPELCEGSVTVLPAVVQGNVCFYVGGATLGPDLLPPEIEGSAGETRKLSFYYSSEEDYQPGGAQLDQLQGVSMGLIFDCDLTVKEETFEVTPDTITSAVDADYVNFHADNDPNDGDGCEMVLAILVEADPPFEGSTLPPTPRPLKLGTVDVEISAQAACGACSAIEFKDGVNGRAKVPVRNLYAAENASFVPCLVPTRVCVSGQPVFRRGDCNYDTRVNTTDAVQVLRYIFPAWSGEYTPPCRSACDADDSGRIQVSDAITILSWLFLMGPPPPDPGPLVPGPDPTPDELDCNVLECR